jgi:hypothetical protein
MGTPSRKPRWSLSASLMQYMGGWRSNKTSPPVPEEPDSQYYRVGNFFADYSQPTREEIDAIDPEVEKLFAESREVSEKK